MSIRSIFEINHDYTHEIERDPEIFLQRLLRYLGSASEESALPLERYGLRLAWWGHHSEERRVVTKYQDVKL
jgi:hypothetical protein